MNHLSNRREFLVQSTRLVAAAVCRGSLAASAPGAADFTNQDIDAHAHVWIDDVQRYPLAGSFTADQLIPRTFPPEPLLEMAGRHGFGRIVLIQHNVYHGVDNSYLIDTLARFPGRFAGVAAIKADDQASAEMDRLGGLGVRGFRIGEGDCGGQLWSECDAMRAMWRHASERGFVMCPLISPAFLSEVDKLAGDFPDVRVVIDHFARIGTDGKIRDADVAALRQLARHPRVHCKVSAFYGIGDQRPPYDEITPLIRAVFDAYGPQRLLWGSDCPYQLIFGQNNSYEAAARYVREDLPFLTDDDRNWLLRRTAEQLFFQPTK